MLLVFDKYASADFKRKIKSLVFNITLKNKVPICSGLGSSASALLGGIIAAYRILKRKIVIEEVLALDNSRRQRITRLLISCTAATSMLARISS